jgi:cephalosporin hydroxylase
MKLAMPCPTPHGVPLGSRHRFANAGTRDPDHEGSRESYANIANKTKKWESMAKRFQGMAERADTTCTTRESAEQILEAALSISWRGASLLKCGYDLAYYPMLIQELKPRTIIETGAYCGASAMWLNDVCMANLGLGYCKVISSDLTLENVAPNCRACPDIEFVQASNAQLVATLTPGRIRNLPRPLLFIEDAHYEFETLLETVHKDVLQPGDYLIVEDTNPVFSEVWCDKEWLRKNDLDSQIDENLMVARKRGILRELCLKHADLYCVDAFYQDLHGYNNGKLANSIIKRIA